MVAVAMNGSLSRGVYVAPWVGPKGEVVLLAVTREQKLAESPRIVPIGANQAIVRDEMWARLEHEDPQPILRIV